MYATDSPSIAPTQNRPRKPNARSPQKASRRPAPPHSAWLELKRNRTSLIPSPFVRAAQTAEIFAETLGYSVNKIKVSEALKPTAPPAEIVKEITRLRAKEVMVFGHAPHLDLLAAHLIGARTFTEIKKAGVACFEHAASTGKWNLRWLVTPKILREIAD